MVVNPNIRDVLGHLEELSSTAASMFPDDAGSLPRLLELCKSRDDRCARFVGVEKLKQLQSKFDTNQHVLADVVGDGKKNRDCPARGTHNHIHSHFYSVADAKRSKRRKVPIFLFWKARLGWEFPVTDEMVETVRDQLDSCESGFLPGNGHLKKRGILCVHPLHLVPRYDLEDYQRMLSSLVRVLAVTGLLTDSGVLCYLHKLGFNMAQNTYSSLPQGLGEKAPTIFNQLCLHIANLWQQHGQTCQNGSPVDLSSAPAARPAGIEISGSRSSSSTRATATTIDRTRYESALYSSSSALEDRNEEDLAAAQILEGLSDEERSSPRSVGNRKRKPEPLNKDSGHPDEQHKRHHKSRHQPHHPRSQTMKQPEQLGQLASVRQPSVLSSPTTTYSSSMYLPPTTTNGASSRMSMFPRVYGGPGPEAYLFPQQPGMFQQVAMQPTHLQQQSSQPPHQQQDFYHLFTPAMMPQTPNFQQPQAQLHQYPPSVYFGMQPPVPVQHHQPQPPISEQSGAGIVGSPQTPPQQPMALIQNPGAMMPPQQHPQQVHSQLVPQPRQFHMPSTSTQ